jgi:hypothetical protein
MPWQSQQGLPLGGTGSRVQKVGLGFPSRTWGGQVAKMRGKDLGQAPLTPSVQ